MKNPGGKQLEGIPVAVELAALDAAEVDAEAEPVSEPVSEPVKGLVTVQPLVAIWLLAQSEIN